VYAHGAFQAWSNINNVLNGVWSPMLTVLNGNFVDVSKASNNEKLRMLEEHFLVQPIHDFMAKFH
jgi:hypothetical protein